MPVGELEPGARVDSVYHLLSVERRTKKNGDPFFTMQLGDATGFVNGVMWDHHDNLQTEIVRRDQFVRVQGDCAEYNGKPQLTVRQIKPLEDSEVDLRAFLPMSPRPRDEMEAELDEWIGKVKEKNCRRLLDAVFGHKQLRELYCTAPAAARIHQAYIHGLMEHTLNVMKLAAGMASLYEPVNRDLLITGTLIHDIGKIRELEWKRVITYTTEGRLLGHIPMGTTLINAMIETLRKHGEFDRDVQTQLLHMILSHHGKLEWGSPITPKTREAFVLHYADHAEAYMSAFAQEARKTMEKGEAWTDWSKLFDSYLFVGSVPESTGTADEANPAPEEEALRGRSPMDDVLPAT